MKHRKTTVRRRYGRYSGARVNCEQVPCLPAGAVAWVLNDPRQVPYLMVWKDDRSEDVVEVVRVAAHRERETLDWNGWVSVKRPDENASLVRTIERPMQRNGGRDRLLVCPRCQKPCRALYGWRLNPAKLYSAFRSDWQCRSCARLRYASEGGALLHRPRTTIGKCFAQIDGFVRHPRPNPLYPYVFANPCNADANSVKIQSIRSLREEIFGYENGYPKDSLSCSD